MALDAAVAQLAFKDFEWQPKGLHQGAAFVADGAVDLDAEAIAQLSVLLQILLHWGIADMGGECCIVGINLRPNKSLRVIGILIKRVMQHSRFARFNRCIGGTGQFQVSLNAVRLDVDAGQQHERSGAVEATHQIA